MLLLFLFSFCEISFLWIWAKFLPFFALLSFFPVCLSFSVSVSFLFSSLFCLVVVALSALFRFPFPHCPQFLFCPRVLSVFQQTGYDDEEGGAAAGRGGGGGGRGARFTSVQLIEFLFFVLRRCVFCLFFFFCFSLCFCNRKWWRNPQFFVDLKLGVSLFLWDVSCRPLRLLLLLLLFLILVLTSNIAGCMKMP